MSLRQQQVSPNPNWIGKVFLWQEQALFLGQAADTCLHASPAIKICIALDGEFNLRTAETGKWEKLQSTIIAPGQIHAIDGRKKTVAMLLLTPEAEMAQPLSAIYSQQSLSVISRSTVQKLSLLFGDFVGLDELNSETDYVCRLMIENIKSDKQIKSQKRSVLALDPRVISAIRQLRAETEISASVGEIAANVALSESRFSHLFSTQLGLPMRRYLLWLRLREAMRLLAAGTSLTETAHKAGFSDSAHLTRTFRGMLGITPSALIKHSSLIPAKQ